VKKRYSAAGGPSDPEMGDAALPCFMLAKTLRKAPQKIAEDIAAEIKKPDYNPK
jgi:arginyl-tRNA synthetase